VNRVLFIVHAKKYQLQEKNPELNRMPTHDYYYQKMYFSLGFYDFYRHRDDNNACEYLDFYAGCDI